MAAKSDTGRRSFAVAVGGAGWAATRTEIGKAAPARPMTAAIATTRADFEAKPGSNRMRMRGSPPPGGGRSARVSGPGGGDGRAGNSAWVFRWHRRHPAPDCLRQSDPPPPGEGFPDTLLGPRRNLTRYDLRITPLPARSAIAAAARDRAAPLRSRLRVRSAERRARLLRSVSQSTERP